MRATPDLFGTPPLPIDGLKFRDAFVSPAEEDALIAQLATIDLPLFAFQRWLSKRRTRSFGHTYDFGAAALDHAEPIPDFLDPVRLRAAEFAGKPADALVQLSIIKYEPDAGIGWHKDRREFGIVIGISLGHAATMRFRRRTEAGFERASLSLPPRSLYVIDGSARTEWEHSIAPSGGTRWSLTLRSLAS